MLKVTGQTSSSDPISRRGYNNYIAGLSKAIHTLNMLGDSQIICLYAFCLVLGVALLKLTPPSQNTFQIQRVKTLREYQVQRTCRSLLTEGAWQNFTLVQSPEPSSAVILKYPPFTFNPKNTHGNRFRQIENSSFTYTANFSNNDCAIHHYTTGQIKSCIRGYDEFVIFGYSRSRILYQVLLGRYKGIRHGLGTKTHGNLISPPFKFFWSTNFTVTIDTLLKNYVNKDKHRLIVIGEQLQVNTF